MITDRNEAFMHNSCKKLAQLGKVIFTMSAQILDRKDEASDLMNEMEDLIQKAVNDYHENAESIAKDLVKFRKQCVDDACKEFGSLYKQLKVDYANLRATQGDRLQNLLTESKEIITNIKEFQNEALASASEVMKAADEFSIGVRSHIPRPSTARKVVKDSVQPIFDKMDQAQIEADQRVKQIRSEHMTKMAESKKEIAIFIKDELRGRKDRFIAIQNDINSLKSELHGIKHDFAASIRQGKEFYHAKHEYRDDLVKGTREACTDVARQMKNIRNSDQKALKQHNVTISDLKTQLQRNKNAHKSQIDALRRQAKEQKLKRHQFSDRTGFELQKRKDALGSVTQEIVKAQKLHVKKKKAIHKSIVANINECDTDTKRLLDLLKQNIDDSISKMDNKILTVRYKIESQEADAVKRFSEQREEYKQILIERVNVLESAVEAHKEITDLAHTKQVKRNRHIRHEIKRGNRANNENLNAIQEKAKNQYDKAANYNQERRDNKMKEIENTMKRRTSEREKRQHDLKTGFSNDIRVIEKEQTDKNQKIIENYKDEEMKKLSLDKEIKENDLNMSKVKAKNDFLSKRIHELKDECAKMEENFVNDISSLEKAKRQFSRMTKTETQRIDEEYEMKIQVAQVNLRESIENISKLYDSDENMRGVEIIEAIRKVREAKNRTNDFRMRKENEMITMKKEFDKKVNDFQEQIDKYQNSVLENQLKSKMEDIQQNSDKNIENLTNHAQQQIDSLTQKIEEQKIKTNKELQEIKNQIDSETNEFENQTDEIDFEKSKFDMDKEQQIGDIDEKFDTLFEKEDSEHKASLERMQKRIEAAKNTLNEVVEKQKKEIEEVRNRHCDELRRKRSENDKSIENIFSEDKKQCDFLTNKIDEMSKKQSELEFVLIDLPQRHSEVVKIESTKKRIISEDEKAQRSFEAFYEMIRSAPNHVTEEEPPAIVQRAQTAAKSSRKEKTPRVMTPNMTLESKMKKRPQLVSPQFV
ncbi:hypothetical protein TRFO_31981 [Tritrichomonas foetus]|uniref:Uncharacterized protein n=1 Tax=Tritrichomonas foetus TaxID=1144522 RepID=A0A1J4JUP1_9EUKA|nr:hypothetical protein TRFO_31981 [Tritrichomonas foetus]|eukprot:OHT01238.1 hypothetical protein TRFO_31981 [Tritrichomonas foetus]